VFHLATVDPDGHPKNRPINFVMEYQGHLFFCTGSMKKMYDEMIKVPFVEISGFNGTTSEWIRVHGKVKSVDDKAGKERVFKLSPMVAGLYKSVDNPTFKIFSVEGQADFYKFGPTPGPFKTTPLK
jgi:uncharacterized pyridoxamine 5'-phosphate oxidase family protein